MRFPISILFCLISLKFVLNESIESQDAWTNSVVASDFATVVEFKSGMCSSCQEFEPEWKKITDHVKGVRFASVDIDKPFGMKLARSFGVLDEGIPNIRIFGGSKAKGIPVFSGEGNALQIIPKINKALKTDKGIFFDPGAHMYSKLKGLKQPSAERDL
jgi:thioredoxin-like negative regulator of GroEL